jgi:hypothetical protein
MPDTDTIVTDADGKTVTDTNDKDTGGDKDKEPSRLEKVESELETIYERQKNASAKIADDGRKLKEAEQREAELKAQNVMLQQRIVDGAELKPVTTNGQDGDADVGDYYKDVIFDGMDPEVYKTVAAVRQESYDRASVAIKRADELQAELNARDARSEVSAKREATTSKFVEQGLDDKEVGAIMSAYDSGDLVTAAQIHTLATSKKEAREAEVVRRESDRRIITPVGTEVTVAESAVDSSVLTNLATQLKSMDAGSDEMRDMVTNLYSEYTEAQVDQIFAKMEAAA